MSKSSHVAKMVMKLSQKNVILAILFMLIIYEIGINVLFQIQGVLHFQLQAISSPIINASTSSNNMMQSPITYFNSKGLITAKCVTQPLDKMNNEKKLLAEYNNAITKTADTLKIKFFLFNEFPIEMIRDSWNLNQQQHFEYLKNHPNRVYNVSEAQVVLFQTALGGGVERSPCYGVSEYAFIQPYVNHTHYGDNITNDEWKMFYKNKQFDTKIRWIVFQNVSQHSGFGQSSKVSKTVLDHVIKTIHDLHNQYPELYFLVQADNSQGDKLKQALKPYSYNRTMRAFVNMDNKRYRKHIDISLPPPFIAGLGRDNHLIVEAQELDPCRKRKFFATFYGATTSHRTRKWIIQYHNETLRQIFVSKRKVPKFKNGTKRWNFDDVLINTDYVMAPRGTNVKSFRWREGLEAGNINIMMADDYILPFNDYIDWKQYEVENAIVIIKEDEFIETTNATIIAYGELDLKQLWLKQLDTNQLCNAHKKVKQLRETYFRDTSIETNTLLLNVQANILFDKF